MKKWVNTYCKFCNKPIEYEYFPPACTCEGYIKAYEEWVEDCKKEEGYEETLSEEDYNKKYPLIFSSERVVQDRDGQHKINLGARDYIDGIGMCCWIPIGDGENNAGLCWDITEDDGRQLLSMLEEYFKDKR